MTDLSTELFLDLVYGDIKGYVDIITKSDTGLLDNERWFAWPKEKALVLKYVGLRGDEDVYCSAGVFSDKVRTKSDKRAKCKVVYADADTCVPLNFRLAPSIPVETSKGRWHAWWVLDTEVSLHDASEASHRIAKAHKAQGCDGGWIESKILRVPNTTNTKRDPHETVTGIFTGEVFTLNDINMAYLDVDLNANEVSIDYTEVPPLLDVFDLLGQIKDPSLFSLYSEEVPNGGSWSERLWRLELDLFRAGFNPLEVFTLCWSAKCNKYHPENAGSVTQTGVPIPSRANPQEVLWQEIQKAELSWQDPEVIADLEAIVPTDASSLEFITPDERDFVHSRRTFIDEYVDWVATKTDAAQTYSRSLAYLLLSSVYGQHGYIHPKYGKTRLNLWFLTLGDTTRTRKSTAKNKFLAVVREWEKHTGGKIELASDFTSEGLTKALGERDGLVSLMHRDEIQGFFLEAYNKTYMSGIMGTLTDLYDGFVRVVLRSTKDSGQSRRSESTFNFLGIGITYDVAEVLTDKNFRDGFLARFLWSIAEPPELTRESEDMQQAVETGADVFKVDAQITSFCNEFSVSQRKWADKDVVIRFDNASMKRFNDWKWQTAKLAEVSINKSSVEPSRQRLALSVWKCAALLAMHERKDTITLAQLLPVLEQAESWYSDMERMAGLISANDFQRKVNALEAYVLAGAGQRRNIANVYKTMLSTQGLRKIEVDEVIQNLIFQGRIRQARDEGKVLLEVIA